MKLIVDEGKTLYTINFTKNIPKDFFIFKVNKIEHNNLCNELQNGSFLIYY